MNAYTRLHVLPHATIREAARFLGAALLLSHTIRRDTAALVEVSGRWILAVGGRIRHFRPDQDTSEGWVRATLRGAKLGGVVLESPPGPVGRVVLVEAGDGRGLGSLPGPPLTLCYGECPYEPEERVNGDLEPWRSAIVANIVLDRVSSWGLGGCG